MREPSACHEFFPLGGVIGLPFFCRPTKKSPWRLAARDAVDPKVTAISPPLRLPARPAQHVKRPGPGSGSIFFDEEPGKRKHPPAVIGPQPCFGVRLGGMSGGRVTQRCLESSHTEIVGPGKFGSAKVPMATAT